MKLSINKNTLESAITLCSAYVEKKDLTAINSHFLLEANEDKLIIKATDYEIGLTYRIKKINIERQGFATVNAKNIIDMIKNLNNEDLILETIDNSLFIRQKNTKYKLSMFDYEDFPKFPNTEDKNKLNIDSSDLSKSLKKIFPAIDTQNPKYSLNGALIDIKNDKINFVGSDTKRLAIYTLKQNNNKELAISIPKKAIAEMQKLFYEKIELFYDENILIAKNENFEFYTKLINDKFPDYEKVIPKNLGINLTLNTEEFINSIKIMSVVTKRIRVSFSKSKISFEGSGESGSSEAKTEIQRELNIQDDFSLNIQAEYFMDFLNSIETEEFELKINEPNLAFIISSQDLQTIIIPVIL